MDEKDELLMGLNSNDDDDRPKGRHLSICLDVMVALMRNNTIALNNNYENWMLLIGLLTWLLLIVVAFCFVACRSLIGWSTISSLFFLRHQERAADSLSYLPNPTK